MPTLEDVGRDWLIDEVDSMPDSVERITPVLFNEENRYLPQGVSPRPGYIRYDLFPFLREIIECFDPLSHVREVNLMKGVQTGYTTLLESILLYYIAHIKTQAAMFITADKELAAGRMENNIIPMINESGFSDLIRSSDEGNSRKTGKTKDFLQWEGGGYLIYNGALNAAKMRQYSVPLMLKDELDGWKRSVGQDGNSDALTDARLSAYWSVRKILRGSTPLLEPSMIGEAYEKGDQRKYLVLCKACSFPQELKQEHVNEETGIIGGFKWDTEDGTLLLESVRYCCANCGHEHYETDKERLFSEEHGAHWKPTAKPREPGIRSYHLPSFYSPFGFRPWYKGISDYLEAFDPSTKQVKSVSKLQEYYNNTLGVPFKVMGAKVRFTSVSAHRRAVYRLGQIPNKYAAQHSGSKILFLTCQVDVHLRNLAVSVMGWTRDLRCYVVDYWRFERENDSDDCGELSSPVWQRLRDLIEEQVYEADDGTKYRVALTLVDAGYANDTVTTFCSDYEAGVYPILGRDRPGKNQTIKEFAEFKTQSGTTGYRILVDHYKDRLAPVLRRDWSEELGQQKIYHFNAPVDIADKQLKELTVESRREKTDDKGNTVYYWHRPGNAPNELWDLLGYGHAAVEILAWSICIQFFEMDSVNWPDFWDFAESDDNRDLFGRLAQ
jgi:phage terminase large subunit GpA-like protein